MRPYLYKPLGENDVTRVLQLHPSQDYNAPLRCDILPWQANGQPYEALSYAWGDPTPKDVIFCDGENCSVEIAQNLGAALRALRKPSKMRTLWVDAVCINQQGAIERARQVREMPLIYRKASIVVAWIGLDYESGAEVIGFFNKHEKGLMSIERYLRRGSDRYEKPKRERVLIAMEIVRESLHESFGKNTLEPFRLLFKRPWFKRRWIIQEAILAQEAHVQCGSVLVKLSALATGAMAMNLFYVLLERGHTLDPKFLIDEHTSDILQGIATENRRKNRRGMTAPGLRFRILDLLSSFHAAQCSDDRDRIYALLGVSDDILPRSDEGPYSHVGSKRRIGQHRMSVSYQSNVEDVYTRFAIKLLKWSYLDPSDILHLASAFRPTNPSVVKNLPSWIPDWRFPRRFLPIQHRRDVVGPNSDMKKRYQLRLSNNNQELLLLGWKHSTMSEKLDVVCDFETCSFEELRTTMQHWVRFYCGNRLQDCHGAKTNETPFLERSEWLNDFFDCVTMARTSWYSSSRPPNEFCELIFEGLLKNESTSIEEEKDRITGRKLATTASGTEIEISEKLAQSRKLKRQDDGKAITIAYNSDISRSDALLRLRSCTRTLIELLRGRCLFRTEKGRVLNCPDDAKVGDIIAIFYDIDTPFVLRLMPPSEAQQMKVQRSQRTRDERYRLVGDCFVKGLMERRYGRGRRGLDMRQCGEARGFVIV